MPNPSWAFSVWICPNQLPLTIHGNDNNEEILGILKPLSFNHWILKLVQWTSFLRLSAPDNLSVLYGFFKHIFNDPIQMPLRLSQWFSHSVWSPDVLPQRWCSNPRMEGWMSQRRRSFRNCNNFIFIKSDERTVYRQRNTLRWWRPGSAWSGWPPGRYSPR